MRGSFFALVLGLSIMFGACGSQNVPPAHKGQLYDQTGAAVLFIGGDGLTGPVVGPGTYWTGMYDDYKLVNCSIFTVKEGMTALTKDNVQFLLDIYVRYNGDCSDEAVKTILSKAPTDNNHVVPVQYVYDTYLRPSLGEAVREVVSPFRANDINDRRETILANIRTTFLKMIESKQPKVISILEVNLSNMLPPDELMKANVARAEQAVLKDKAIAERERVTAEIETAKMKTDLAAQEGKVEAAKIDQIGAALRRNPEYLTFDLQTKMPGIYREAGEKGNLVLAAPNPSVLFSKK